MRRKTDPRRPRPARSTGAAPSPATRGPLGASASLTPELLGELEAIAAASGCELLAAEWKGGVLRLILDRPASFSGGGPETAAAAENAEHLEHAEGGVSLGDCEHVSKQVSAFLDVADFGGGRYTLEVSSPGLDRQLYRASDYQRFRGRLARVTFEDPETRRKRTIVGRLEQLDESAGIVELATGDSRQQRVAIPLDSVRLARLEVEFERSDKTHARHRVRSGNARDREHPDNARDPRAS